jgi:hypothetical protein
LRRRAYDLQDPEMPYRKRPEQSPRDQVGDETRMCFAAAGGCLLAGAMGSLVNVLAEIHTPLPALAVVGGFYGVMGLARWWKWSRMKPDDIADHAPGH